MDKIKQSGMLDMQKLKEGASVAGTKSFQLAKGAGHGIMKTGEGIKNIPDSYNQLTEKFHSHKFNPDEELISQYKTDLKQAVAGLKHIRRQLKKLSYDHWRLLFKINLKIVDDFLALVGPNSLNFKGIEKYYHDWYEYQASQPIPLVHPLDRRFLIDSVNIQLNDYLCSVTALQSEIVNDWESQYDRLSMQIDEVITYCKQALKLVKLWFKKKMVSDKLTRKIDKINSNATLDESQQLKLTELELQLSQANDEFSKIANKTKAVLPNLVSFLDEFVDTLTKLILSKQIQTYDIIRSSFMNFATYFGQVNLEVRKDGSPKEEGTLESTNDSHIQSYQQIIDEWETVSTPIRLQIESFITLIYNKKPELLDNQINDQDESSKASKLVDGITKKITTRKFTFKGKDLQNGLFVDYLESDPLQSFTKYFDETLNRSETYHPRKLVNYTDLVVTPPDVNKPVPPLPPRSNIVENRSYIPLPHELKPSITVSKSSFGSPPSTPYYVQRNFTTDSIDSTASSSGDDDDASSVISETASDVSSLVSNDILERSGKENIQRQLQKLYNSQKNEIKVAPISPDGHYHIHTHAANDALSLPSTMTTKLAEYNRLFDKIIAATKKSTSPPKHAKAKYDFKGDKPGDLSFKADDDIEILLDFQSINTLYDKNNSNWLIGLIRSSDPNYRVGFVPNNYLSL
jgi:hypothetical protein